MYAEVVKFNKYKHKNSNWITKGIIQSIKFRDKLHSKLKRTPTESEKHYTLKTNLKVYNKILKSNIRLAKKMYYESCFFKYKNDMRKTWSTINCVLNKNKKCRQVPESFQDDGKLITNKLDIATTFNEYFTNIGPNLANNIKTNSKKTYKHYLANTTNTNFNFVNIDENTVNEIIDKLDPKASCGWDGLSMQLIKEIQPVIVKSLTIIINQMLNTGIFPDKLKIAKVIPLFKKENDALFTNYRPISLLPAISKIFEKAIYNQLYNYFQTNKLFYSSQYGFRAGHSTELAALELVDRVIHDMDNGKIPINIFLDLSKAFDTLDHKIILNKLHHYGLHSSSLNLMKSYLTNRKQFGGY